MANSWRESEFDRDEPVWQLMETNRAQHPEGDAWRWYATYPYDNWPQRRKRGKLTRNPLYDKHDPLRKA